MRGEFRWADVAIISAGLILFFLVVLVLALARLRQARPSQQLEWCDRRGRWRGAQPRRRHPSAVV